MDGKRHLREEGRGRRIDGDDLMGIAGRAELDQRADGLGDTASLWIEKADDMKDASDGHGFLEWGKGA
jgi:hypothetical protein